MGEMELGVSMACLRYSRRTHLHISVPLFSFSGSAAYAMLPNTDCDGNKCTARN